MPPARLNMVIAALRVYAGMSWAYRWSLTDEWHGHDARSCMAASGRSSAMLKSQGCSGAACATRTSALLLALMVRLGSLTTGRIGKRSTSGLLSEIPQHHCDVTGATWAPSRADFGALAHVSVEHSVPIDMDLRKTHWVRFLEQVGLQHIVSLLDSLRSSLRRLVHVFFVLSVVSSEIVFA